MRTKLSLFRCKSGKNTIVGDIIRPAGEGKYPLFIIGHGFGSCRMETIRFAQRIAPKGYVCAVFDFCGGGRIYNFSGGKTTDMTLLTEKDDVFAVMDFMLKKPYVDTDNIYLGGCSQGGMVAALAAAQKPDLIKKLVLYYPALCIPYNAANGILMYKKCDVNNLPKRLHVAGMVIGAEYFRTAMKINLDEIEAAYKNPVLICQGSADESGLLSFSRDAKNHYADCEYVEIEGGDHGFHKTGLTRASKETIAFFAKNR